MAGTIKPIAALTSDDYGPINTIVSIVLPTVTILFAFVRVVVRHQKVVGFDLDDLVFGISLCFGITASVVSHFCVRAGLGRHQDQLDEAQVERYFKLFWTTQFLGIVALASAKLSVVFMFKRIDPIQMGPPTIKWLVPTVAAYTVVTFCLIGFQCQLPHPWILKPKMCSTHGNVYYPITTFNILTDLVLSFWLLPAIWALRMTNDTKYTIMALCGSRLAVCIVDIGRMAVIHKALQSDDQTRSQLLWAIMDQLVIHVSINHATLPRVYIFLANLQTGLLATRITATQRDPQRSETPRSNSTLDNDSSILHSPLTTRTGGSGAYGHKWRWTGYRSWNSLLSISKLGLGVSKTPSISEHPLRLRPEQGIELSTTVYAGHEGWTSSNMAPASKTLSSQASAPLSLSRDEGLTREDGKGEAKLGGVRVQKEIKMAYNGV